MSEPEELAELFLSSLAEDTRADYQVVEDLGELLLKLDRDARAEWPDIDYARESFVRSLAQCGSQSSGKKALEALPTADIYIARACAEGVPAALRLFEKRYGGELDKVYDRIGSQVIGRHDFRQLVWERILVHHNGPPRIATYRGRGSLGAWLRMTGRRLLLNLIRDAGPLPTELDEDRLLRTMASETQDVLSDIDKAQHRHWFKEALGEALQALDTDERNLLRYRFVDGASMDEVAKILGVHRVSASRRLARIKKTIIEMVHKDMRDKAGLDSEFSAILVGIQSNLELSLSRLLN